MFRAKNDPGQEAHRQSETIAYAVFEGGRRWTRVHTQESTRVPEVADLSLLGTSQPVAGKFGDLRPLASSPMVMISRAHGLYVTETRLDAKEFTTSIGRS